MGVRIIIDSTADVSPESKSRLHTVPLMIFFGDEEYVDGVTITQPEFYDKLMASEKLPTTSQPTPAAFMAAFQAARDAGDSAVVLTISSRLSGTYQSACIAAADFDGIYVVDSRNAAMGLGCLAELALQLADQGKTASEIAEIITRERENIRLFALLDTLEYLKKGGRISGTVAFVGGMLSIKPVIQVNDGALEMVGTVRGARQGAKFLMEQVQKAGGMDLSRPVILGYTGNDSTAVTKFAADNASRLPENVPVTQVCSVIGTHVGPGVVALAYFKMD